MRCWPTRPVSTSTCTAAALPATPAAPSAPPSRSRAEWGCWPSPASASCGGEAGRGRLCLTNRFGRHFAPSPGTPGEGGGGGFFAGNAEEDPHPNPPPEYRERGRGFVRHSLALAHAGEAHDETQKHGWGAKPAASEAAGLLLRGLSS